MDTLSSHACRSMQSYWRRRRAYDRLDGSSTSTSKNRRGSTVRLGGGTKSRRARTFRLIIRVKMIIPSPKKLLGRLRDAYVNAMLSWSGKAPEPAARKKIARSKDAGGDTIKIRDFEMRMIMNIYNTVMANPREAMMINSRAMSSS